MDPYILVVDDDPDMLALMKSWVKPLGLEVKQAAGGKDALDIIRQELPSFVLLDLMMPGMDGFSVLGRLKLDPDKRHIPILIVTAAEHTDEEILSQGSNLVIGIVRKGNIDPKDVRTLVSDTLGLS